MRDEGRPLSTGELATLLVRMEQAIAGTSRGFAYGLAMVAGLFVAMALMYGVVFGEWGIAGVVLAFGAGIGLLGRAAVKKTAPARMQPVMDAVRDAPERILLVRHYETSDSARMFVSHWLEVKTAEHRLVMKANDDWQTLGWFLRRRCPGAAVKGL